MPKNFKGFGSGSNSNGQFWYGNQTDFPGFLYKKNVGVGTRRSTLFAAGGNITCNQETYLYNKYKPGQNGVGASSIANRRAKNRTATICNGENDCYPCYMTLGQYNNYLYNPNGFYPCPPLPLVPFAPTITNIVAGETQLTIYFIPPSDGGASITNYFYSLNNGPFISSDSITSPIIITGLSSGKRYIISLRAVNSVGNGVPSPLFSATTLTSPSSPTITSIVSGSTFLTVNFNAPSSDGGTSITDYLYSINNGSSFSSSGTTSSPITITGLSIGTTYYIILKAVNSVGNGNATPLFIATTLNTPSAPTITSIISGSTLLTVNFNAPSSDGGATITNYLYSVNNGLSFTSSGSTTSPITITGLTVGTSYNVILKAVNSVGNGSASNMVTATTLNTPSSPTITSIVAGSTQLTVNFTAPSSDGGATITNYLYSVNNGLSFTSSGSTTSPITITGLLTNTTYNVILKAVNSVGNGTASNMVTATTLGIWYNLVEGLNNVVNAIAIDSNNNNVYVGGSFQETDSGNTVNYIAIYSLMTGIWSDLNFGLNNVVNAIAIDSNNNVYVGGSFTTTTGSGVTVNRIAKWDGTTWSSLGTGGNNGLNAGSCNAIAIDSSNNVYVGGSFTKAGSANNTNRIAKWTPTTSTWSALGTGLNNICNAIAIDSSNNVYAGGTFTAPFSGSPSSMLRIGKFNISTNTWSVLSYPLLGNGLNNICNAIAIDSNNNVYAGGTFTAAGTLIPLSVNRIARWNQTTWSALGTGLNNTCNAIAIDSSDNVYAGGTFTTAGGNSALCIAKWTPSTSTWSALGTGLTGTATPSARSIKLKSNVLYAGGSFTTAGGIPANYIAEYS